MREGAWITGAWVLGLPFLGQGEAGGWGRVQHGVSMWHVQVQGWWLMAGPTELMEHGSARVCSPASDQPIGICQEHCICSANGERKEEMRVRGFPGQC